jgi:hypothetical protein
MSYGFLPELLAFAVNPAVFMFAEQNPSTGRVPDVSPLLFILLWFESPVVKEPSFVGLPTKVRHTSSKAASTMSTV